MKGFIVIGGLVGLIIFWVIKLIFHRNSINIYRDGLKSLFLLYVIGVLALTFSGLIAFYAVTLDWTFNIIPLKETLQMFRNDFSVALYQVSGNIAMFIPFGIFIPMLYKKEQNIFKVGLFSFLFSLLIEVSQVLLGRIGDIDDLIFNTLGGVIGFLIFIVFKKVFKNIYCKIVADRSFFKSALPYTIIIFSYIYLLGVGNIYNFIKNSTIPVSNIAANITESGQDIVLEEEIDGYKYIMSTKEEDLMITSYENDKKYIFDLYQNTITDNLHPDYVYRGDSGEFINYTTQAPTIESPISHMIVYVKADIGNTIEFTTDDTKISFPVNNEYMIKKLDLSALNLPQETILKINLIKD
ncbi:hypothetical protein GNF80_10655 [Clostridium perfringens]|nr:hypothetical protein [Clostridium perfringens]